MRPGLSIARDNRDSFSTLGAKIMAKMDHLFLGSVNRKTFSIGISFEMTPEIFVTLPRETRTDLNFSARSFRR